MHWLFKRAQVDAALLGGAKEHRARLARVLGERVADASIQVHGGIGFTWEHDLHFFLKRATSDAALFGDPKWHREQVAERVLADVGEIAAVA